MSGVVAASGSYAAMDPSVDTPARPLRIEMVVPSLPAAGMEMMVVALARALAGRGHGVGVTCLRDLGPLAAPLEADGVPVSLVPAPGVLSNFRAPVLARHLASLRPDVVHSHSGVWGPAAVAGGGPADGGGWGGVPGADEGDDEAREREQGQRQGGASPPGLLHGGVDRGHGEDPELADVVLSRAGLSGHRGRPPSWVGTSGRPRGRR